MKDSSLSLPSLGSRAWVLEKLCRTPRVTIVSSKRFCRIGRAQNNCHRHMLSTDAHRTAAKATFNFRMLLRIMCGAHR